MTHLRRKTDRVPEPQLAMGAAVEQKEETFKHLGWQAIGLDVPQDWSLHRAKGDERKGSFELDDGSLVRLSAAWVPGPRRRSPEAYVERFYRTFEKWCASRKPPFECERKAPFHKFTDGAGECFEARGQGRVYAMLHYCSTCHRIVTLQLTFLEREKGRAVARRVFRSLTDHPSDGRKRWAVFGLDCYVPERFNLEVSELLAGQIVFGFIHRKEEVEACRFSLASVLTKQGPLSEWFESRFRKKLKGIKTSREEGTFKGHPSVDYRGGRGLMRTKSGRPRHGIGLLCRIWHCEESDKLYVARWKGPQPDVAEFERFATSFVCH